MKRSMPTVWWMNSGACQCKLAFGKKCSKSGPPLTALTLFEIPASLASDLQQVIGHALILESTKLECIHDLLSREPIIQMFTGGDLTNIPIYRWRHIRDYTLRIDDGRFGFPCLCLALDVDQVGNMRHEKLLRDNMLEYLIRSEQVLGVKAGHGELRGKLMDSLSQVFNLGIILQQSRKFL